MRLVKIAVASVSVRVGDYRGNAQNLRHVIELAREQKAHLLVTPELAISGYSLEDRVFWPNVCHYSWECLESLRDATEGIAVFVGLPVRIDDRLYNAAALLYNGAIRGLILKKNLPTYSIFYEGRHWSSWEGGVTDCNGVPAGNLVFELPFGRVSAEICEDLFSAESPARERVQAGAEIICNLSASPFSPLKNETRKQLVTVAASKLNVVYAYANLLGCDSSRLVFDGGNIIATPDGIIAEGPLLSRNYYTIQCAVADLDQVRRHRLENSTWRQVTQPDDAAAEVDTIRLFCGGTWTPAPIREYTAHLPASFYISADSADIASREQKALDELFDALVLGLRDYFEKVGVFRKFLVALSGGRDSALCLLMAVEAAKSLQGGAAASAWQEHIESVYLPNSRHSSSATLDAAQSLAQELNVPFRILKIDEEVVVAEKLAAELMGGREHIAPLALQNLQARVRGAIMLNWANSVGGLVLVTSNLSEAAVGYSTTGGDNQGGYSPIANVPKTLVSRLLEHLARTRNIQSLQKIFAIPPSAELAPDQQDEKDLMPYVILDDLLHLYAAQRLALPDCWRVLICRHPDRDPEQLRLWTADFARRFCANQWKRDQHPVALKVLPLDLDPKTGFRFPVSQSIERELQELRDAQFEPNT